LFSCEFQHKKRDFRTQTQNKEASQKLFNVCADFTQNTNELSSKLCNEEYIDILVTLCL